MAEGCEGEKIIKLKIINHVSTKVFLPFCRGSKPAADWKHTHIQGRFLCVLKIDLLITGVQESRKVGGVHCCLPRVEKAEKYHWISITLCEWKLTSEFNFFVFAAAAWFQYCRAAWASFCRSVCHSIRERCNTALLVSGKRAHWSNF
jgi:hypothetical protein